MPYNLKSSAWASTPSLPIHHSDAKGPPPYEHVAAASSGFVARTETTTTTQTVVTRTTTTFIPLNRWNNVDKDLPATPTDSSRSPSPPYPQLRGRSSIVALAQASLGLGLGLQPHVTAAGSRSAADGGQTTPRPRTRPAHVLRKSKSFSRDPHPYDHQHEPPAPPTPKPSPQKAFVEQRTRRMSFGASLLQTFHIGASSADPVPALPPTPPPQQSTTSLNLARKSSFWSRKRATTLEVAVDSPPLPPTPALPSVQPFSPLAIDNVSSSSLSSDAQSNLPQPASNSRIIPSSNIPTPPASASAITSDGAALQRRSTYSSSGPPSRRHSPSLSLNDAQRASPRVSFLAPPVPPSRLTDSPVDEHHPQLPQTPSPAPHVTRQRAMTNPTLLRRISFFASAPPPPPPPPEDQPPVEPEQPAPKPPQTKPPQPQGESPELYVQRLIEAVSKAEVANVLASRCV